MKKISTLISIVFVAANLQAQVPDSWTEKKGLGLNAPASTYPVPRYGAVSFSIGTKGYIGTGNDGAFNYSYQRRDFWEFDPATNVWTQKANYGIFGRRFAVGFSIGNKGYIGAGYSGSSDFWEYDPAINSWVQKASVPAGSRYGAVGFGIGAKGYVGTGTANGTTGKNDFWEYDPATNTWTQKANYGGGLRFYATGFSIGNKGYIGTGSDGSVATNDFWEYDPSTNIWTQKANYGGSIKMQASGMTIGSKGYIGTGTDNGASSFNDFWEYDPTLNSWTQRANVGGFTRFAATAFSIGNKGYLGTGDGYSIQNDLWEFDPSVNTWTLLTNLNSTARTRTAGFTIGTKIYLGTGHDGLVKNDFWEYNPSTDIWTQKANFGGAARHGACGFSIGAKGYIGTGYWNGGKFNDFWEYDPSTNVWTQKTNFPGTARHGAVGLSIGNKGYIGLGDGSGYKDDFYEYDPSSNSWTQKAVFAGGARTGTCGFTIGNKGYVGMGLDGSIKNDLWEYDPATNAWVQKAALPTAGRNFAASFSLGGKGYMGTGENNLYANDFWEYDPVADTWIQRAYFGGPARSMAIGFAVGTKGYMGLGASLAFVHRNDFWEYTPPVSNQSPEGMFFDGSDDRITVPANTAYNFGTGNFTLEAIIKADISYYITMGIMSTQTANTGFAMKINSGIIGFTLQNTSGSFGNTGTDLRDNTCHHIALVRTAGVLKGYIDGQLVSPTNGITVNSDINNTNFLSLGTDLSSSQRFFRGLMREARIWNVARTQGEIQANKDIYLNGNESGLIGYWRLTDGTGQTIDDLSVTNNDGFKGTTSSVDVADPVNSTGCLLCVPPTASITPGGSTTFCSGGSITLSANSGTGFGYQWKKNGADISGATNQNYNPTASGSYTVIVTNACGTATSSAVTVTINPLPSATITPAGPTTFCSGGSVVLNAPVAANRTYQWKKGTNLISGATLSSYTATTGGNYKVIVTNTVTGCSKTTGSATVVTVNALPTATITPQGPTTFCAGGSVVLTANTGAGLTYKWKKGNGIIGSATNQNYTATTAGTYKVIVTNSNLCSKTSPGIIVSVPCKEGEAIVLRNNLDFTVYPNPNSGEFTIKFSTKPFSPIQIELTDEIGKLVKRFETNDEIVLINESYLAEGIYWLTVRSKDKVVIERINIVK